MTDAVAISYHPDGYIERHGGGRPGPVGLMGRQVAGQQFLRAYLNHGTGPATFVVADQRLAEPLIEQSRTFSRPITVETEAAFFAAARPRVLHVPHPPEERFAWQRQSPGRPRFALCGVTHTLCSTGVTAALRSFLTAPFEPYDVLVCTSRSAERMVRAVLDDYGAYLADRFGGRPPTGPTLAVVPLGVDADAHRPATPAERQTARDRLQVQTDEVVVLCVGRLSHHAKAHPHPLFVACESATTRTGRAVHLMFAGWAAHPAVLEAYRSGAAAFAPSVRTTFVDGHTDHFRKDIWHAADIVASVPDNIQETFGLAVIEGMASGLPLFATDWNGYRDTVVDGETGYRIPTFGIPGAADGLTAELLLGSRNYDHFVAASSQTIVVDLAAASDALTRLVADEPLRRRFGEAGRKRVLERFRWSVVLDRYAEVWQEQHDRLCRDWVGTRTEPAAFPGLDRSFHDHPTAWLPDDTRLRVDWSAVSVLQHPLANPAADRRLPFDQIEHLLNLADGKTLGEVVAAVGSSPQAVRATVAWLLKYGVLRRTADGSSG